MQDYDIFESYVKSYNKWRLFVCYDPKYQTLGAVRAYLERIESVRARENFLKRK